MQKVWRWSFHPGWWQWQRSHQPCVDFQRIFRKKSKKFQEEIPVYPENPDFTPWWSVMSWHGMIWHALASQHSHRIAWPLGPMGLRTYWTFMELANQLTFCNFSEFWIKRFGTQHDHGTLRSVTSEHSKNHGNPKYLGDQKNHHPVQNKIEQKQTMRPRVNGNIWVQVKTPPSLGQAVLSLSPLFRGLGLNPAEPQPSCLTA